MSHQVLRFVEDKRRGRTRPYEAWAYYAPGVVGQTGMAVDLGRFATFDAAADAIRERIDAPWELAFDRGVVRAPGVGGVWVSVGYSDNATLITVRDSRAPANPIGCAS